MILDHMQSPEFSKSELALLAMMFNLLEHWAEGYMANRYEGRPADEVIASFNDQALTLGIMLASLIEKTPDLIDQMDDVIREAKDFVEQPS